ncbi:uncharacterized protein LOC123887459 isoform X1 [Trifolium pratense]|uniref:uncharacterized protein LOC123887459 isoform X1 n=1 Tax=Trifolium pratense TaxID=57577 RepID=UPI001E6954C4|nr:uncharacterized protein LOC123887459 isoform X1 [Trifolium pratense]
MGLIHVIILVTLQGRGNHACSPFLQPFSLAFAPPFSPMLIRILLIRISFNIILIVTFTLFILLNGINFSSTGASFTQRKRVTESSTGSFPRRGRLTSVTEESSCVSLTYDLPLDQGGGEGKAMDIEAKGTFRPQRLLQIADRFELNGADVLKKKTHLLNFLQTTTYDIFEESWFFFFSSSQTV